MASITIDISEQELQFLKALASLYGISVDVLLRSSFEVWLSDRRSDFADASDYVLARNFELYKRLA